MKSTHSTLQGIALCTLMIVLTIGCSSAPTATAPAPTTKLTPIIQYAETPVPTVTSTTLPATATTTAAPTLEPTATEVKVTETPDPDPNMNPFTGMVISDTARKNIPVLVKISNSPEVRPQTGLALADVVVEHYAEGGITRFTALYLTHTPTKVGSVRSCRLIDIELPVIFGAGIVCSGTSGGTRLEIKDSISWKGSGGDVRKTVWIVGDLGYYECQQQAGCKLPMYRMPGYAPHNLFASVPSALNELTTRKVNKPTTFNSWIFNSTAPSAGSSVNQVNIPYTSGTVSWKYSVTSGDWSRSIGNVPHTDVVTRKPLTATNVAVLFANHITTLIVEDVGGAHSIQIQLWNEGPLQLFRDGRMITGVWKRVGNSIGLSFVDSTGQIIPLKPGSTWIEMVPLTMKIKTS